MTKIILLMWLADIAGNIGFIGAICIIVSIVSAVFMAIIADDAEEWWERVKAGWVVARWFVLFGAIATVIPNPSTIRLAAAGVAVQEAAQTVAGQKAMAAFNAVLDSMIAKAQKELAK